VEWKAKGAAIQELTKQLQLGKDMQLDAAEFVRRAERGLGVAIREGQLDGSILSRGQVITHANQHGKSFGDREQCPIARPTDFATSGELSGRSNEGGIYAMTARLGLAGVKHQIGRAVFGDEPDRLDLRSKRLPDTPV
jgi:hypothetical protein